MEDRLTERLRLRSWRDADLAPLAAIYADPDVMRYIGDGSVRTREETAAQLGRMRGEWVEYGYGMFAVEVRGTGELAGWVGIRVPGFLPEVLPAVEIGWRLGKPFWGRGFATEAAREVLEFAFAEVGLARLVSICRPENVASARVMVKLGMWHERRTTVPGSGVAVDVMELTRDAWQVANSSR
jgi:RimJ/RimL family protein N-acetyltransferase